MPVAPGRCSLSTREKIPMFAPMSRNTPSSGRYGRTASTSSRTVSSWRASHSPSDRVGRSVAKRRRTFSASQRAFLNTDSGAPQPRLSRPDAGDCAATCAPGGSLEASLSVGADHPFGVPRCRRAHGFETPCGALDSREVYPAQGPDSPPLSSPRNPRSRSPSPATSHETLHSDLVRARTDPPRVRGQPDHGGPRGPRNADPAPDGRHGRVCHREQRARPSTDMWLASTSTRAPG